MTYAKSLFANLFADPVRNGIYKSKEFQGKGIAVIKMNELYENRIIRSQNVNFDLLEVNESEKSRFLLQEQDLLFSRTSVVPEGVGLCSIVADLGAANGELLFDSNMIRVTLDKSLCNPWFFFYYFQTRLARLQMFSISNGAAIRTIRGTDLGTLEVPLPLRTMQNKIAAFFSAYDDLIEHNQRRIALLEDAARQLYREWFMRLRFPGHEHTRIVDGVPEGWKRVKMRDICESVGGGTPSTARSEFWEGGDITWVIPTDITRNNCLVLLDTEKKITEAGYKNSSAKMVPAETILMTSRASLCFFGLIDREVCTNQGFISVIPKEDSIRMYLLHNLMSRKDEMIAKASGATYKEINKSVFRDMDVVIPGHLLVESFQEFAYDILKQERNLKKQESKLRAARDILLPRLMSGEIAV